MAIAEFLGGLFPWEGRSANFFENSCSLMQGIMHIYALHIMQAESLPLDSQAEIQMFR